MADVVGVLALQGAFGKHIEMLAAMDIVCQRVRFAHELDECVALIIPGGESTTMSLLIHKFDLYDKLKKFAENKPVMGICAGAILMAEKVDDTRVSPLNIMPVTALRNSYGRQVCSFSTDLRLKCDHEGLAYLARFIRADNHKLNNDTIEVKAQCEGEEVLTWMGWSRPQTFGTPGGPLLRSGCTPHPTPPNPYRWLPP